MRKRLTKTPKYTEDRDKERERQETKTRRQGQRDRDKKRERKMDIHTKRLFTTVQAMLTVLLA